MRLSEDDQAALDGRRGEAQRLAMRVITRVGEAMGAADLLDITGAHIDSCLYHGQVGLDFAQRLLDGGGEVVVPTTLNVVSLDLIHPELYRGDPDTGAAARQLMELYEALGCSPTWTCAPYQLEARPDFGDHVAWAESNAIVFANSVLGARTHRYGDFIDICAAITGRAPAAGLHLDENRLATFELRVEGVSPELVDRDLLYPVLGHFLGGVAGSEVAAITGLPSHLGEDRLKALGSAAASSGSVGLFHAVGSTPEAATLEQALGLNTPTRIVKVGPKQLRDARKELSTTASSKLGVVSLGTPHYSMAEFVRLAEVLGNQVVHRSVAMYVSTGRDVLLEIGLRGIARVLQDAGVQIVTDTCTYITPVMAEVDGVAMTDSAKWAYYAPGNLAVEVVFGSVEDCVRSAVVGRVVRDEDLWV